MVCCLVCFEAASSYVLVTCLKLKLRCSFDVHLRGLTGLCRSNAAVQFWYAYLDLFLHIRRTDTASGLKITTANQSKDQQLFCWIHPHQENFDFDFASLCNDGRNEKHDEKSLVN